METKLAFRVVLGFTGLSTAPAHNTAAKRLGMREYVVP